MEVLVISSNSFVIANLLVLVIILWARKANSLANAILGAFVLAHAISLTFNMLFYAGLIYPSYYYLTGFSSCLVGPFAYFYCKLMLKGRSSVLKISSLLHFLPSFFFPLSLRLADSMQFSADTGEYPDFMKLIIFFHVPGYYIYCWIFYRRHMQSSLNSMDDNERFKAKWIRDFIFSLSAFIGLYYCIHLLLIVLKGPGNTGSAAFSPFVVLLFYILILKKAVGYNPLFGKTADISLKKEKKTPSRVLREDLMEALDRRLLEVLDSQKLYLDKELNMSKLSELLEASPKHLSYLINTRYQVNFNDFINRYRVEEARRMILDPEMGNLKLEAIGEAAGFNSRASFFSTFKKVTGLTPASFKKEQIPDIL